jgi:DNA invertase Pin-like site-specific DNA recombinase
MIFGYCRVSTKDQNLARQTAALNEYAVRHNLTIDRIFEEKVSGRSFSREVYQGMKMAFRRGDILIIKELDRLGRLGRNMEQIKDEWDALQKMGVDIIVIDTEILNTANRTDLEKTLISNLMFVLLSYISEKEREKIRTRQAEGIKIAKKAGKYTGRKPIQNLI